MKVFSYDLFSSMTLFRRRVGIEKVGLRGMGNIHWSKSQKIKYQTHTNEKYSVLIKE